MTDAEKLAQVKSLMNITGTGFGRPACRVLTLRRTRDPCAGCIGGQNAGP